MNEKTIEQYLQDIIEQALMIGIPVSKRINKKVFINTRAVSRFGACIKKVDRYGETFSIEIGEAVLGCDERIAKGIIAHEVLHTCRGCQNHGAQWKASADAMNSAYGYHIARATSYEALGIAEPVKKRKPKYLVVCRQCGNTFSRQKRSRLVTHPHLYRCKCGGKLTSHRCQQDKT
jgi:predicted SprT family Zn-dependent metalloprotease